MFRKLLTIVPIVTILNVMPALAQNWSTIYAVPTNWRLENYPGSAVTAWFTGSPCQNGNISLPSNTTEADKNRFFATIMLAKATSRSVGIFYIVQNGNCVIQSFWLQGQ